MSEAGRILVKGLVATVVDQQHLEGWRIHLSRQGFKLQGKNIIRPMTRDDDAGHDAFPHRSIPYQDAERVGRRKPVVFKTGKAMMLSGDVPRLPSRRAGW